ncbi:longitudinals lacking isoform X9 [Haematobia irritans]|uniref:longitudinals lacking isoform X9 n=1 Tax=Haematobia irritans TaxID=7368 RepID=UPI003F4F8BB2
MDDDQQFCLRWNNHQSTLISVFDTLLENETLVDCTLAAEGKYLKAHKVVLSACSPYFATLLQEQYDKHPIFILKDVKYQELRAMMDYMYRGEVNISQDQLAALLKAAESLQIKGLSDNRSGGSASQPKPDHHRASMPGKLSGGYTLEQTKRARITGAGGPAIDASEMGSREGSSSPSRRRRKVRRRSIENALTDVHDNSNSSQQPTQSNASGLGAITAAASALAAAAAVAPTTAAALASTVVPLSATQQQPPQQTSSSAVSTAVPGTTLSSSKKTDNVKGSTQHQQQQDAMNTENVQGPAASATPAMDTDATDASTADKSNHKQQKSSATGASKDTSSVTGSDLVIEPKAEYDDEANDENVEDLTLDEEDMGMDDLDHNAGTSQGGEGSSQGYAPWQHDRSQDELLLATQEAQQRDPQDIYPILGSLLGVDTNNSNEQSPNNSNNDLFQAYGYLNNSNVTIHATAPRSSGTGGSGSTAGATNATHNSSSNNGAGSGLTPGSILINALSGGGSSGGGGGVHVGAVGVTSLLERDDYMQCKHCKRFYKSMQKLQEHVRKYCLKEKKYKCVSCEYRSRRKDHVLRHAKRKHCDLYEQYREDEEALFVIRTEEDGDDQMGGRYDTDMDYDEPMNDYLVPSISLGLGSSGGSCSGNGGGVGGGSLSNLDSSVGFKFGCRDLTITAVPIMQDSEEDDDDYDEDD